MIYLTIYLIIGVLFGQLYQRYNEDWYELQVDTFWKAVGYYAVSMVAWLPTLLIAVYMNIYDSTKIRKQMKKGRKNNV